MKKILILCLILALGQGYALAKGYKLLVKKNGTNHVKYSTTDVSRDRNAGRYFLICVDGSKFYTNYRNNYINDRYEVWRNGPGHGKVCNIKTRNNL